MSPTRRQVDSKKILRPSTPLHSTSTAPTHSIVSRYGRWERAATRGAALSSFQRPCLFLRAGRAIHSTAPGGAIERVGGAQLAATCRRRTASSCARSPCPSPPSAHRRAAGSCARDSRLTHHPRRPAPRHRIRRWEHASLSMSPVCRGGELVSALARARRGVSGGAGRGRGAPASGSTVRTSGRRGSGAGPACGGRRAGRPRLGVWLA